MKKIVCLALTLGLMLCACCAWAAEPVVIDFAQLNDWKNKSYFDTADRTWKWSRYYDDDDDHRLFINKSGEYTIRNMHDGGGLLGASIVIADDADNVTLNLENVKLSGYWLAEYNALFKNDAGTLKVKLDKNTVLSAMNSGNAIAVRSDDGKADGKILLDVCGAGSIGGVCGIFVQVLNSNIACPVTVNVSGSVQITGSDAGVCAVNNNETASADSGDVTVNVGGSVQITGDYKKGIYVWNRNRTGNSGDVKVNVSGSAKVSAPQGSDYGIYATSSVKEDGDSGDVAVNVTGNAQLIAESDVYRGIWAESDAAGDNSGDVSVSAGPGVDITTRSYGISARSFSSAGSSGKVGVTVDGSRITAGKGDYGFGIYATSSTATGVRSDDVRVSVRGGAKIASETDVGILALSMYSRGVVTLGDNVTVQGQKGAVEMEKDKGELIIDGKTYLGIAAEKSMEYSGAGAQALPSSPYYDANKNVIAEAGAWTKKDAASQYAFVTNARFIRTLWSPESAVLPQTRSLPQTGDSSSLALWGAMLAIALAGAGMLARKNREA